MECTEKYKIRISVVLVNTIESIISQKKQNKTNFWMTKQNRNRK